MSNGIERPVFFENQILGAADLTATVEHGSGQQARHHRYLHLWGIARGLELKGVPKQEDGNAFQEITLSAGMAIDGWGREIVVPQSKRLIEDEFDNALLTGGVDLATEWFPVFLTGQDGDAPQPPIAIGRCNDAAPTRKVETYQVTFGRPGDARDLDSQTEAKETDGPGKGGWKILLGFVKWGDGLNKFTAVQDEVNNIGRRYAGVQADVVAARGGSLKLRTQTTSQSGKPALTLEETKDGGLLQFGSLTAQGKLVSVFTVNAKGDVEVKGKIKGALAGGVHLESGIATDGMILPLPPGITEQQVADGDAVIHTHVASRLDVNAKPNSAALTGNLAATPLEIAVNAERRVSCRVRWFQIGAATPAIEDHPGLCNYVVLATVKEK